MDPPPPEEGILINFGTDDQGFGQEQTQSSVKTSKEVIQEEITEALRHWDHFKHVTPLVQISC